MKSPNRRYKKILLVAAAVLLFGFTVLLIFVNRFIEPVLKDRLHTLIIQGSDSLYTYTLGRLNANFFGGNVEVENLQIRVDSNRYAYLRARNALPSLTMQLTLGRGHIKGIGVMDLLFGKKVKAREILSRDANLKLSRHVVTHQKEEEHLPLWKAIEPKINRIEIGRIRLEGVKMNYKNADTSESVKIEFEGCDALFDDIVIDSAASLDTSRVGFTRTIKLRIEEAKYRTPDSSYKLKMDTVSYSSADKILNIKDFKFQPTIKGEEFYKGKTVQQSMYIIKFDRIQFLGLHLDHFIRNNHIDPEQVIFDSADISIYNDKTLLPDFESKIGSYPHQKLLKAGSLINIKSILLRGGHVSYTEKSNKTLQEGTLLLDKLHLEAGNITNDPAWITKNRICSAKVGGQILGGSPFNIIFSLYLDSTNGRYDAQGSIQNVSTAQLNSIALPLANVRINDLNINALDFMVSGEDFGAESNVRMRYRGLSVEVRKLDEETGNIKTKKFITKLLNKFIMWPSNPGPDGIERKAYNRHVARLTTQSFFGLLWKAIFAGMQDIMMKSGRYE